MTQPDTTPTSTTIDGAAPRDDALVAGAPDIHAPGLPPGGGHVDPSPSRIMYRRSKPTAPAETSVSAGEQPAPPSESANKATWVDYTVDVHQVDRDAAEAMTKADLIASYGGGA